MGVLDWPSPGADRTLHYTLFLCGPVTTITGQSMKILSQSSLLFFSLSILHSWSLFLIDPSTGRAVQQEGSRPRLPYWQWGSSYLPRPVQSELSVMQDLVAATDTEEREESEQTVQRSYGPVPHTPYVQTQQAEPRNDYVSVHGTPLYKLRKRNPYGRK